MVEYEEILAVWAARVGSGMNNDMLFQRRRRVDTRPVSRGSWWVGKDRQQLNAEAHAHAGQMSHSPEAKQVRGIVIGQVVSGRRS